MTIPVADEAAVDAAIAHEQPVFREAIKAVIAADLDRLDTLLAEQPSLVTAHSSSEHGSTLLHYVSANSVEDALQLYENSVYTRLRLGRSRDPEQDRSAAVQVVSRLVAAGAEVDAVAQSATSNADQTTLNWLVSSAHPAEAGVMESLVRELCRLGANVDGRNDNRSPMITALAFGYPIAVSVLLEFGAKTDCLLLAAAAGRIDAVKQYHRDGSWSTEGIARCQQPWFRIPDDPERLAEFSLVFACMTGQCEVARYFIESGVDVDAMPDGTHMTATPLHTAAIMGQVETVKMLCDSGADPTRVEPRYNSTAEGWANHTGHDRVVRVLRERTPEYRRQREGQLPEVRAFVEAVFSGDNQRLAATLNERPLTPTQLDGPWFHFDQPAIVQVKSSLELVDTLLAAGADINKKSEWWAGGFGVLDGTDSALVDSLVKRGAVWDVWSAAEHGKLPELTRMVDANPEQVHAKGPDGKRPLHCASCVEIAEFLLDRGADIDAIDVDHGSTAAQYHVKSRPDVARYLVQCGCKSDVLMACALGDSQLLKRLLKESPQSIETIVSRSWFPTDAADSIYSWSLGWYATAHQVAKKFDHDALLPELFEASSASWALVNACLLQMTDRAQEILAKHKSVVAEMPTSHAVQMAHAARNNDANAVRAMLSVGMSPSVFGQHQATPLHWAAFHGNAELVAEILRFDPPLDATDADFQATPSGWAEHGSQHGWNLPGNDYPATIDLLRR